MSPELKAADRLFVALDVPSLAEATAMLEKLRGVVTGCKIGSQLITAAGAAAVEAAHARGFRVFLDLQFHDIPNTAAGAVREATRMGVFMLNVHASGGVAMMRAAAESAAKAATEFRVTRPLVIGVTVLTSLDRRALQAEVGVPLSVEAHVLHLARLSREAGLDGSVASPREIGLLRIGMGRAWAIVAPGIRPTGESDDHARSATPAAAVAAGADYLVVGRPITGAKDPAAAAAAIVGELSGPQ